MRITYTPPDGPAQEWDFRPGRLMSIEAEAIERQTGWTFEEFGQKFMAGSALARHALLWVLLKRKNPGVKYADINFAMDEVTVDLDDDEYARLRERVLGSDELTDTAKAELLAQFPEHAEPSGDADPKDDPAPT